MALSRDNHLGHQILNRVDRLIQVIYSAGPDGKEEETLAEGCVLLRELLNLLEQIIGPRDDYLNQAVRELINQRIPEHRLLKNYDDFFSLLDRICRHVQESRPQPILKQEPVVCYQPSCPEGNLRRALTALFPNVQVVANYRHRGLAFSYFLPSLNLALDQVDGKSDQVRKEFFCRRDGIKLIRLAENQTDDYRELLRYLRRRLKNFQDHLQN